MPDIRYGGGHEDYEEELRLLREIRGQTQDTSRAQEQLRRDTEAANEELAAQQQKEQEAARERSRLAAENRRFDQQREQAAGVTPAADIDATTAAIRRQTQARREAAAAAAAQRREQQAADRQNLIARGAAAGTLQIVPAAAAGAVAGAAASRYVIQEGTTGQAVSGRFGSLEAAQRRLASIMDEQAAIRGQIVASTRAERAAQEEQQRNASALVALGRRELAAREAVVRSLVDLREVVDAETMEVKGLLGPGPGMRVQRHPLMFGQGDYGPGYSMRVPPGAQGVNEGFGREFRVGGGFGDLDAAYNVRRAYNEVFGEVHGELRQAYDDWQRLGAVANEHADRLQTFRSQFRGVTPSGPIPPERIEEQQRLTENWANAYKEQLAAWQRFKSLSGGAPPGAGPPPGDPAYARGPRLLGQAQPGPFQGVASDYDPTAAAHYSTARTEAGLRSAMGEEAWGAYAQRAQQAGQAVDNFAMREQRLAEMTRLSSVEFTTASQAMYRHGALTAEFLQAAMRGEVTMRELGNQVAITSLKFGGWTLAATAVYGAARAIGELGRGAIQTENIVAELGRYLKTNLNTDEARQQIRALARDMNLPIEQVGPAVTASARVSQTQAETFQRARATLLLSRVGDLDPTRAVGFANALTTGFRMSADQLSLFVDQLNQLQNRMNIPFDVSAGAVSRAAGNVRAAGGTPVQLAALVAAARRGSGLSGDILGTTFQRAAQLIGRSTNRQELAAFGINPDQNFDQIFAQAMRLVHTGQVQGRGVIQLATALSSPQLAGRGITAALSSSDQYYRALQLEDPKTARGSAQRELNQLLTSVSEQIHRIGVQLQALGGALAQSGLLDIFKIMLSSLNAALSLTYQFTQLWNALPAPIRHVGALVAEVAIGMRLMSRFGVFNPEGIIGRRIPTLATFDDPQRRLQAFATRGMRGAVEQAERGREAATAEWATRSAQIQREQMTRGAFVADYAARAEAGTLPPRGTSARFSLDQRLAEEERAAQAAEEELARLKGMSVAASEQVLAAQADLNRVQRAQIAEIEATLAMYNIPFPASFRTGEIRGAQVIADAGARENVRTIAGQPRRVFTAGAGSDAQYVYGPQGGIIGVQGAEEGAATATSGLASFRSGVQRQQARLNEWAAEQQRLGATGRVAVGAANAALVATDTAAGTLGRLGRSGGVLSRLGAGIAGLIAGLNVFDIALITYFAGSAAINHFKGVYSDSISRADTLASGQTPDRASFQRLSTMAQQSLARQRRGGPAPWEVAIGSVLGGTLGTFVGGLPGAALGSAAGAGLVEGFDRLFHGSEYKAAQGYADWQKELSTVQARQRAAGKPIPQRFVADITHDISSAQSDREAGIIGFKEFDKRLATYAIELQTSLDPRPADLAHARQILAQAAASGDQRATLRKQLAAMDDKTLGQFMQTQQALLPQYGFGDAQGRAAFTALAESYREAVSRYGGSTDPAAIQNLLSARQAFLQTIDQTAQQDLQIALGNAQSYGDVNQAYRAAGVNYSRGVSEVRRHLRAADRGQAGAQTRLALDQQALRAQRGIRDSLLGGGAGLEYGDAIGRNLPGGQADVTAVEARIKQDKADVAKFKADHKKWSDELDAAQRDLAQNRIQLRDTYFQERSTRRQTEAGIDAARSTDPTAQQRADLQTARGNLDDARKTYGARAPQTRQALLAYLQAENALNTSVIQQANSLNDVLGQIQQGADVGDALAQAHDALNSALGTRIDPRDPLSGPRRRQAIQQAQAQIHDATLQRAQAQSQLAQAQTTDPVRQAELQIQLARQELGMARGYDERIAAQRDLAQADQQLFQAQTQYRDAQFEYLKTLTTDPTRQAAIDVREARYNLARATNPTERVQAQTTLRQREQTFRDTRFQGREDDIQFNLDMQKITREEAISQFESLAQSRGITKSVRRDLLRRIKQLKDQSNQEASGFALDVGQIKLPTIYDVRRSLAGVRRGMDLASTNTHIRSEVTFNIDVHDAAQADRVYDQIDRAMRTNVRARMRTAGMRG